MNDNRLSHLLDRILGFEKENEQQKQRPHSKDSNRSNRFKPVVLTYKASGHNILYQCFHCTQITPLDLFIIKNVLCKAFINSACNYSIL